MWRVCMCSSARFEQDAAVPTWITVVFDRRAVCSCFTRQRYTSSLWMVLAVFFAASPLGVRVFTAARLKRSFVRALREAARAVLGLSIYLTRAPEM